MISWYFRVLNSPSLELFLVAVQSCWASFWQVSSCLANFGHISKTFQLGSIYWVGDKSKTVRGRGLPCRLLTGCHVLLRFCRLQWSSFWLYIICKDPNLRAFSIQNELFFQTKLLSSWQRPLVFGKDRYVRGLIGVYVCYVFLYYRGAIIVFIAVDVYGRAWAYSCFRPPYTSTLSFSRQKLELSCIFLACCNWWLGTIAMKCSPFPTIGQQNFFEQTSFSGSWCPDWWCFVLY